jgi:hypothetical protein
LANTNQQRRCAWRYRVWRGSGRQHCSSSSFRLEPGPQTGRGPFRPRHGHGTQGLVRWTGRTRVPGETGMQCGPAWSSDPDLGGCLSGSLDGHMRAYETSSGTYVWDFDTSGQFQTVNSVDAHGGSLNYSGAVVAGGKVYVMSGYSINAGMPGNVLLAFSVSKPALTGLLETKDLKNAISPAPPARLSISEGTWTYGHLAFSSELFQ